MPTRDVAPVGAPCWIDLFTSDPDRSIAFYGELFGWAHQVGGEEHGGYITFSLGDVPVAGAMRNDGSQGAPDGWTTYLAVEDAEKALAVAEAVGAQRLMGPMEIPGGVGTVGILADPTGANLGIWQPGDHKGFGVLGEPGAPGWFELHTSAYDTAVAFYRDAFAWDLHTEGDTPEFRYSTLGTGDAALAGIMDGTVYGRPADLPGEWTIYFTTADVDASIAKAVELGATLVQGPDDTPYGKLAELTDPTGAKFKLVQNPA